MADVVLKETEKLRCNLTKDQFESCRVIRDRKYKKAHSEATAAR